MMVSSSPDGPMPDAVEIEIPEQRLDTVLEALGNSLLSNAATGMGTHRDAASYTRVSSGHLLGEAELRALYRGSWLIRRIVEAPADDMTKAVEIAVHSGGGDRLIRKVMQIYQDGGQLESPYARRQGCDAAIRKALIWARLFGQGYCVMRVNGGEDPAKPLTRVRSFEGLSVLDRYSLRPALESINAEHPEVYQIARRDSMGYETEQGLGQKIHESRILVFSGAQLHPYDLHIDGGSGHDSVIQQVYDSFVRHMMAKDAIGKGLDSFSLFKVAISGLSTLMQAPNGTATLTSYLNTVASSLSMHRVLVQDADASNSEFQERSFAGVAENFRLFVEELTAATGLPHYKIWGSVDKAGLADSGGAESRAWAETVQSMQNRDIKDEHRRLFHAIFEAVGKPPKSWDIEYPSIYTPTPEEEGAIAKVQSETLTAYVREGIVTATQAYQSLATGQPLENVLEPLADDEVLTIVDEVEEEGPSAEEELAALLEEDGEQPTPDVDPAAEVEPEPVPQLDSADASGDERLVLLAAKSIYGGFDNWEVRGVRNLQVGTPEGGLTVEVIITSEDGELLRLGCTWDGETWADRLLSEDKSDALRIDAPKKGGKGGTSPNCKKGRPCGRACISMTKNCRVNPTGTVKEALDKVAGGSGTAQPDRAAAPTAPAGGGGNAAPSGNNATPPSSPAAALAAKGQQLKGTELVIYAGDRSAANTPAQPKGKYWDDAPDPGTKAVTMKELKAGLYDYFGVKNDRSMKSSGSFQRVTDGMGKVDLKDPATVRAIYRKAVGTPADETNPPPGPAVINGVNIMRNHLPWQAMGFNTPAERNKATAASVKAAYRKVLFGQNLHPDIGGDPAVFERFTMMRDSLLSIWE